MSSVVIAGNTSGTITLDAPNVAGTTVLTLPTANGTVLTTANITSNLPAGSVLQVVQGTYTAASSISTNINVGYASYPSTGLTATITPSSSSNKILVVYTLNGSTSDGQHMVTVIRRAISGGSTSHPFLGDVAASTYQAGSGTRGIPPNSSTITQQSGTYLDSPSTTSAITYTIVGASEGASTWYINNNGSNTTGTTWAARFASSITLMEIKG